MQDAVAGAVGIRGVFEVEVTEGVDEITDMPGAGCNLYGVGKIDWRAHFVAHRLCNVGAAALVFGGDGFHQLQPFGLAGL